MRKVAVVMCQKEDHTSISEPLYSLLRFGCAGRPGLFGNRPPSGAGRDEGGNPRGLASVVAMLQSQRGSGAGAAAAALTGGRSRLSQQHGPFAGVGLAAAAAGHGGEAGKQHGGSVHSHAISPSPTSYQPASPQTQVH